MTHWYKIKMYLCRTLLSYRDTSHNFCMYIVRNIVIVKVYVTVFDVIMNVKVYVTVFDVIIMNVLCMLVKTKTINCIYVSDISL